MAEGPSFMQRGASGVDFFRRGGGGGPYEIVFMKDIRKFFWLFSSLSLVLMAFCGSFFWKWIWLFLKMIGTSACVNKCVSSS